MYGFVFGRSASLEELERLSSIITIIITRARGKEEEETGQSQDDGVHYAVFLGFSVFAPNPCWSVVISHVIGHAGRLVGIQIETSRPYLDEQFDMEYKEHNVGGHVVHVGVHISGNCDLSDGRLYDLGGSTSTQDSTAV
jgi:hypothetical protein